MDEMVLEVQQWLNETYGHNSLFSNLFGGSPINENGQTGQQVEQALIAALQIELGIATPTGSFGSQTAAAFPPMSIRSSDDLSNPTNMEYILQGGFWCKGYNPGGFSGIFYTGTQDAVKSFESDAGITADGVVTAMVMKAILNTDPFVLIANGDPNVRFIQQSLNNNYSAYTGLLQTGGVYSRATNTALIYALQAEEGMSVSEATGTFGPTTTSECPTLQPGDSRSAFVKILQYALCVNSYYDGDFDGIYSETVESAVEKFQGFMALPNTGIANMTTIKGLLSSAGDTNRDAAACDTATILTASTAQAIKRAGFNYVGRYLTGTVGSSTSKALTREELQSIFAAGLNVFPIYEDFSSGEGVNYFSNTQGVFDGISAIDAASQLGFPNGTIIYFAVDIDALDEDITSNILPYFEGVNSSFESRNYPGYKIGVYGTRNVCGRITSAGLAEKDFVADMSTGWSGNLGFKMPSEWSYDQFRTITVGNSSLGYVEVDMDGFSDEDKGTNQIEDSVKTIPTQDELDSARVNAFNIVKGNVPALANFQLPAKIQYDFPFEVTTGLLKVTVTLSESLEPINEVDRVLTIKNGQIQNPFNEGLTSLSQKIEVPNSDQFQSTMAGLASATNSGYITNSVSYDVSAGTVSFTLSANLDSIPVTETYKTVLSISITYTINYTDPSMPEGATFPAEDGYTNYNNYYESIGIGIGVAFGILVIAAVVIFAASALAPVEAVATAIATLATFLQNAVNAFN